jgi:hypothetical protein
MLVLDASFPVRTLLKLGNERIHENAKGLQLKPVQQAWWFMTPHFKRYDRVTINVMPTRRSGRQYSSDDADFDADLSTIGTEIAALVAGIPQNEAVLIRTFLKKPAGPDFTQLLQQSMRAVGIDPDGKLDVDGQERPRIVIDTFGRETATNAYRYCTNVIFTGCLELPRETLAAQYIAETRDLTVPVTSEDIDRLNRGEVWHRICQGLNRAACRDVWVDDHGRTQAKPTNVWLFTRFQKYIEEELGAAMPGVEWKLWMPRYLDEEVVSKETVGSLLIREILEGLEEDKISSMALKEKDTFLSNMPKTTFRRARKLATEGSEWTLQGSSLVRLKTGPGLKTAA